LEYAIVEPVFKEVSNGFQVIPFKEKLNGGTSGGISGRWSEVGGQMSEVVGLCEI